MNDIFINKNKSILQALKKLNALRDVSRLILFVTNNDGSVLGSLTDGDIRRSLAIEPDLLRKVGEIGTDGIVVVDNLMVVGRESGDDGCATWSAERRRDEGVRKMGSLRSYLVHDGSL